MAVRQLALVQPTEEDEKQRLLSSILELYFQLSDRQVHAFKIALRNLHPD